MIARVAVALVIASPVAAAEPLEVGFVNLTSGSGGQAVIASLRAELRTRSDYNPMDPEPALERPRGDRADRPPRLDLAPARKLYRRFKTDDALAALDALEQERRALSPSKALFAQYAAIARLRGEVLAGADREAEARAAFVRSYALSRKKRLDPKRYAPAVRAIYNKAVRGAREGGGELAITAPAGATLWIDGEKVGDAPIKPVDVRGGEHLVTAVLAGHRVENRWVEAGEVELVLAALPELERAAALRQTLSPRAVDVGVLEQIAEAANLDVLVVIAERDSALAVALFDVQSGTLGEWSVPSPQIFGERPAGDPVVVGGGDRRGGDPWYKTWWGISLIAGSAVVTTLIIVTAASAESDFQVGAIDWQ